MPTSSRPIRVLVVDDSALVRKLVTLSLASDPEIQVVGTAKDPYAAKEQIFAVKPDVITLDIEMPRMDGLSFLSLLMKHHPLPVIIMSSLTGAGSELAADSLQRGAVEVLFKPSGSHSAFSDGTLNRKIKAAAQVNMTRLLEQVGTNPARRPAAIDPGSGGASRNKVILIGSSTGGTQALRQILPALPAGIPGICIVQHIQEGFSASLAKRLDGMCAAEVSEARDGDEVRPGRILLAPGNSHMLLRRAGKGFQAHLNNRPMVQFQRPAVDVLFKSAAAAHVGGEGLVILLTGMGVDGAEGMLELHKSGATTIAQNEATCVVHGMPKEAVRLGAVCHELPLQSIPDVITLFARASGRRARLAA
ncbi:MAG: two-component system chemotaxis response regulator CheB [Limisphaerales bacterium]|jgi:two-component system chemotaxis response regulator CheB